MRFETGWRNWPLAALDDWNIDEITAWARAFGVTDPATIRQIRIDLGLPSHNGVRVALSGDIVPVKARGAMLNVFSRSPLFSAGKMGGHKSRSGGKDYDD